MGFKRGVIDQGTDEILKYLRFRLPPDDQGAHLHLGRPTTAQHPAYTLTHAPLCPRSKANGDELCVDRRVGLQ